MKGENSSKCMYIRNTAGIPLKWKNIRNADIMPNWGDICSTADIPKLSEIGGKEHIVFNMEVKL